MVYFQDFLLATKILFRQLWLSISSPDFYYDVYKYYKGYGIKYIFTLSFITSLFYCIILFNYFVCFKNYLLFDQVNSKTSTIDYVINQLPSILSYDGKNVSTDIQEPFYLYDNNKNKVGVIDTKGKLSYLEKVKIPIVLAKDKINFSLTNHNYFSLEYKKLFGSGEKILTIDVIKKACGQILSNIISAFIILGPTIFIILHFISNLIENIFIIVLIYVLCKLYSLNPTIKTSIRLAMFASGANLLLESIITLGMPFLSKYVWLMSLWPMIILFMGLNKVRDEKYNIAS